MRDERQGTSDKGGEKAATITPDKISSLDDIEDFIKDYYNTI